MKNDPIVEEIREIREELAARFDFDVHRIIEDARVRQANASLREAKPKPVENGLPSVGERIPN